jgi:hypothetical protein
VFRRHVDLIEQLKSGPRTLHEVRKACAWYARGLYGCNALRLRVWEAPDLATARALVDDYFTQLLERQRRLGLSPEGERAFVAELDRMHVVDARCELDLRVDGTGTSERLDRSGRLRRGQCGLVLGRLVQCREHADRPQRGRDDAGLGITEGDFERTLCLCPADPTERPQRELACVNIGVLRRDLDELDDSAGALYLEIRDLDPQRAVGRSGRWLRHDRRSRLAWTTRSKNGCNEDRPAKHACIVPASRIDSREHA